MSTLFGGWQRDGKPFDRATLDRLGQTLAPPGADSVGIWQQGSAALGCALLRVWKGSTEPEQPVFGCRGAVLVWDGRLDNSSELNRSLPPKTRPPLPTSDAELAVAAYEAWGDEFVDRLNGDFALALFDETRPALLLARDPVGTRPLFVSMANDSVYFGSRVQALFEQGVSTSPDLDNIAHYLIPLDNGSEDPDGTFFHSVKAVGPGSIYRFLPDRAQHRRYWDFDLDARLPQRSPEEYVEGFAEHLRNAVRRRMRALEPITIAVSGGLDSSAIYAIAESADADARFSGACLLTLDGGRYSDDESFIDALDGRWPGSPIERVTPGPNGSFAAASRRDVQATGLPFLAAYPEAAEALFDSVARSGSRLMTQGIGGDEAVFDSTYLLDLAARGHIPTVMHHIASFQEWMPATPPRFYARKVATDALAATTGGRLAVSYRRKRQWARRRFPWTVDVVRRSLDQGVARPLRSWSHHARSQYSGLRRQETARRFEATTLACWARGLDLALPFLDRDLLAYVISVPGVALNQGGVPKAALRQAFGKELPPEITGRRWKANAGNATHLRMRAAWPEVVRDLLRDRSLVDADILTSEALVRECDDIEKSLERDGSATWRALTIAGMGYWLDSFGR